MSEIRDSIGHKLYMALVIELKAPDGYFLEVAEDPSFAGDGGWWSYISVYQRRQNNCGHCSTDVGSIMLTDDYSMVMVGSNTGYGKKISLATPDAFQQIEAFLVEIARMRS
jgi:hypothetical protein